jgi:hypothetical protein
MSTTKSNRMKALAVGAGRKANGASKVRLVRRKSVFDLVEHSLLLV